MLKFFLSAPYWLKQEDPAIVIPNVVKNSATLSQECNKPSKKFTTTSKHFKALISKTDNFKKKLLFSPQPQNSENDSENLFIDSNKIFTSFENSASYLDLQASINESGNSPVVKSPGSLRKRAKRKLSKNHLTDDTTGKRSPKTRKTSIKPPEVTINLAIDASSPFELTKKQNSDENSSPSSPPSSSTSNVVKNVKGTFIGFSDSQIRESYNRFQTAIKCFEYLKSMESEVFSDMATVSPRLPVSNRIDVLCHTGCADSLQKMNMTTRSKSSYSKADERDRKEQVANCIENLVDATDVLQHKKRQKFDSSGRTEVKQELAKVHQEERKNENSVLSLPDPEMEEATDINSWQHNEKVLRKKRALMFKSVKERNRRRILLDGSVKLYSTGDNVNFVQPEAPVTSKQPEASNESQTDDLKQSFPEKKFAEKKDDTPLFTDLNTYSCVSDSSGEAVLPKMNDSNDASSSNCVMQTNDEPSLVGKSSVSQTCPSKLDVESLEIENEEPKIQVSRMPEADIARSITSQFCLVPSTSQPTVETPCPKLDGDSKSKIKSQIYSSILTEAILDAAKSIHPSERNVDMNLESFPIDIVGKKSPASSIDSLSTDERENYTCNVFPSNYLYAPDTTSRSTSSSVELIEKASQGTVVTISDTVSLPICVENNLLPSQPITISSSTSSSDHPLTAYKYNQTADTLESQELVDEDIVSSDRFTSHDSFVNGTPAKVKCAKLKKSINDQNEKLLDNIRSSFSFVCPMTLSVEKYKSQSISSSNVNIDDSSRHKNEFRNRYVNFPDKPTESPKNFTHHAINR